MPAVGELTAVTLDCPDPSALADFYKQVLGLELFYSDENVAYIGSPDGAGVRLGFQKVDGFQKPEWPTQTKPQQFHLDITVEDLDKAEAALADLGAVKPGTQPMPEMWRVLLDPVGHPFCVSLPMPEE